jgi:hypothetical protein
MTKFQVETPTGVIEVEAAEDATDSEIIELAKKQYIPNSTNTAPDSDAPVAPDTGMNQARVVGGIAGAANAGLRPTVGAVMVMSRGLYNAATAAPVSANPVAAVQAGMATPGSTVKIGDVTRALADPEVRAINAMQMSKDPVLAAKELAPRATAVTQGLGKVAARAMGPYGAITSAQDATQRFSGAQGMADYAQAGISGLGALGYGVGTLPTPAKPFGMGVGMAADAANAGIDYMRQPPGPQPKVNPMTPTYTGPQLSPQEQQNVLQSGSARDKQYFNDQLTMAIRLKAAKKVLGQ